MNFTKIPTVKRNLLLAFICCMAFSVTNAQRNVPVTKPDNRNSLENLDNRAQSFVGKNLNRFGLEKLKDYDVALDTFFSSELRDTLQLMEKTYINNSSSLQKNLQGQKNKITELTSEKSELSTKFNKLLKTAAFSFVIWMLFVIVFLQFRKRKIRKQNNELELTESQLRNTKEDQAQALSAIDKTGRLKNAFHKLSEDADQLAELSKELESNPQTENKWTNEISTAVRKIVTAANMELRLSESVLVQNNEFGDDKVPTDINKLCEEYLAIASRGVTGSGNEFNYQITSDFEKNLPSVKINQAAVGSMLLSILNNAFLSVEDKSNKGVKGYQPKVSISTRILPRFLQIRVRDNGTGMNDVTLQKTGSPYFTTRESGKGAGLGISEAQRIMKEMHKGGIKIESENGNSADVYIKFYL